MQTYRRDKVGGRVWKARDALLVGIGPMPGNEVVVRGAAQLAAALDAQWHAVYVETPGLQRLPEERRRGILGTLKLAQDLGAQTATLAAADPIAALVDYARNHNLGKLVIGRAPRVRPWSRLWRTGAADRIAALGPDLDVVIVNRKERPAASVPREAGGIAMPRWRSMVGALGMSIATTALTLPLAGTLELANIVMLFLLAVVVTAALFGRGPAVLSAIANVCAFDFFFVPPQLSFAVSDAQYLVTFLVMLATGLVVGQLTARLRYQARVASHREERMRHLFELARELSAALATEQVIEIGERFVAAAARCKVAVIALNEDETLSLPPPEETVPTLDEAIARWVVDHSEPAGIGTDTLPSAGSLYLPLRAPVRTRGVLVVEPGNERVLLIPEQRRLLDTCAALIAIALERVHFVTVAQNTLVDMESERLRNSVLAALSHDLRTPLTALVGLADTLSQEMIAHPAGAQAAAIRDQARRMAKLVNQLLEMARLEARRTELRKDWQSLEELVGAALKELEAQLADRQIAIAIPPDLPLVHCDGVLITRVLVNLLENAAKYTPAESPVRIEARLAHDFVEVAVEDRGPGLPPGKEQAIFNKFMRGQSESAIPGVGLGLAICRAIVSAHAGEIRGENPPEGGARFVFTLPAGTPPAVEPETEHDMAAGM
jgi:two-component system sensor histidine kinase KdpD